MLTGRPICRTCAAVCDGGACRLTGYRARVVWWAGLLGCIFAAAVPADDDAATGSPAVHAVRFVTIGPQLDQSTAGQVRNAALSLQTLGQQDGEVLLLLEVLPGPDGLDEILPLAEFLASAEVSAVRTIAWVPESITGPRALLPLACREIVMHPDAELGDLSAFGPLTPEQRDRISRLAARRRNQRVPPVLVEAMIDPTQSLVRVNLRREDGAAETRVVAPEDVPLLREAGLQIIDLHTLKGAGQVAVLSGAQAEAEGILIHHAAQGRAQLAELYHIDPAEFDHARTHSATSRPTLIRVEGEITPLLTAYLKRQIDRAVERGSDLLIFEIESPGGLLQDSLELAFKIADLREREIRTVAYVPRDAVSGAALISLGCDEIYLHPNGKIGDAGPIMQTLDGQVHRAPEKIVSYLREITRELAELKGRPAAVLMAMVDRDLEVFRATHRDNGRVTYMTAAEIEAEDNVWQVGPMVPESAKELLLFVNGRRAHELQVAEPPVKNLAELRERLGVAPEFELVAAQQTWLDDTVFVLNSNIMTGFLFFLGIIFLFLELHITSGLAGILSALCFGVFFWSKFLGGTAGWLEVVLFMLGLACLAIELFLIPGFGVFGVAGGMLVLGSLVMAGVTLSDLDRGVALSQSFSTAKTLGLAIICTIGAGMVLSHYLPKMPLFSSMILSPPTLSENPYASTSTPRPDPRGLTGQQGVAFTMLRPSGKIRVHGELLDAVSNAGYIAAGTPIEIMEVASNRMIVRPSDES